MTFYALLVFLLLPLFSLAAPINTTVREYFIAAEEEIWDYVPLRWNNYLNQSLDDDLLPSETRLGTVYQKAFYRQYTDETFSVPIPHDASLGILGPVIRAEAGDKVRITFLNRARYPHSLFPHTTEACSKHRLPGQFVSTGERYDYEWHIPADHPFPANQSSVVWAYSSKSEPVLDVNAGLFGLVVIYRRGTLEWPSPGSMFQRPRGIDREVFALMSVVDESQSRYLRESAERVGWSEGHLEKMKKRPGFRMSTEMFHINGYMYNNKEIKLEWGTRVRWYVVSFAPSVDEPHTAHWHGATLLYHGHRVDVVDLTAISFEVADMVPDNEGTWLFHCHVSSHFDMGMTTIYNVEKVIITGDEGW
ncbi:hypothetical protein G6F57_003077 [Rhizopus arrhizus]|uniref:Plastocyanin-like domain-containing protein n=1 Tax=Rhizopus oryzae TaxID=64495 RepID=A0A9P6X320_RHIOR|nr:hypothetical protein G6F23_011938 [Rhizopus arrhizus]KAG0767385.1 hypothetical protein G6F24_002838 [Rhizopus arrhizus]KAG0795960.1 hypothetical protein G6F21_001699 [Rhizopus arrhizus]KAG0802652.1 hypothetical protein G6F22_000047 [Rhizopus arrhizus]KAG0818069.1 hypothetical protein G6F20_001875 [Rhizopus arrhizus]